MNIEKKLITKSSLGQLVSKMSKEEKSIYAPVKKDNIVDFGLISSLEEKTDDYITTVQSAKSIVFPRVEKLFDINGTQINVSLKNKNFSEIPEVVLIGTRPCDASGFGILHTIFGGDLDDNIFSTRLKKTTIISIACNKSDNNCFCTSVNGNPGNTNGSDILLTQIENDNYLAEIITEKGRAIVEKYPDLFDTEADVNKEKYIADVAIAFDIDKVLGKISPKFDDKLWLEQSLRCIGCGSCAYVCPTCGCFDIQDVYQGYGGQRNRSWDSCGFDLFTLHASGHNPRSVQSQRWRQRLMHKFQYMFESDNVIGCVGCGRCSKSCSVNMNLKDHLINLERKF
ncbi:4Fe-4S dicluster domain-containing protein [Bacteroidota bacterium]